jgi:hypothetical protein
MVTMTPDERDGSSTQPVGIAALLQAYRSQTGASYQTISERTGIPRSTIGYLITTEPPMRLDLSTVDALASGLSLPRSVVKQAAIVSAGYGEDGQEVALGGTDLLVSRVLALGERDRNIVAALLDALDVRGSDSVGVMAASVFLASLLAR